MDMIDDDKFGRIKCILVNYHYSVIANIVHIIEI